MEMEGSPYPMVATGKTERKAGVAWREIVLRVLALLLTLAAAILLGVNKDTQVVPVSISPDLPTFNVPVTAKSKYSSAFLYFVVTNSIACTSAAVSLALAFAGKRGTRGRSLLAMILLDLMMVALLFSGIGAAGAVGMLGYKGNSHLHWNKVCHIFEKFCHQVTASLGASLLGATVYVLLVALSAGKLQRTS